MNLLIGQFPGVFWARCFDLIVPAFAVEVGSRMGDESLQPGGVIQLPELHIAQNGFGVFVEFLALPDVSGLLFLDLPRIDIPEAVERSSAISIDGSIDG